MSADPIIYCLQNLTDYLQFERLCTDLMNVSGYSDIEPLGGASDGGRDAIHVGRGPEGQTTVFAYSVRPDWGVKLRQDLMRVLEQKHDPDGFVFVSTASFSASERDAAIEHVAERFGWELQLHGLERIRVRLAGDAHHLVAHHPQIFTPPFFPRRGGLSLLRSRDTILVDHIEADHALAAWLARRLQLAGFRSWCYGTAPLAGQDADQSVRALVEERAVQYLPILSAASTQNADFIGRCSMAAGRERFVLPCRLSRSVGERLPSALGRLAACSFEERWSLGLASVLSSLDCLGISPTAAGHGRSAALRAVAPVPVVSADPEPVYTNTFLMHVPDILRVYQVPADRRSATAHELKSVWPHVEVGKGRALAFGPPPSIAAGEVQATGAGFTWRGAHSWEGQRAERLVRRLLYRAVDVACYQAGMTWCDSRKKFYFPVGSTPQHRVKFRHVDGRSTYATLNGQISWGWGDRATRFRYHVCPAPRVSLDPSGEWWLTMRLYIRVTENDGTPFEGKDIGRRRKRVTKSWWNNRWLARTLAVMSALSQGEPRVVIGDGESAVQIHVHPNHWDCPVSIDYEALETVGDFREELALRGAPLEDGDFSD